MRGLRRTLRTALAAAAALALACSRSEVPAARPANVLLVTLDTTRADHLGCYGYGRGTSPELDRLAAEATLYSRAVATSSWTLPAHASLFTGKFATSHGARYDPDGPLVVSDAIRGPADWQQIRARGLAPGARTLASILRDAGLATGAVVAGPWLKRVFGLDQGFDFYDDAEVTTLQGARAAYVTDRALAWLDTGAGRPFFLFLNYFDPHAPYLPPPGFRWAFLGDQRPLYGRDLSPEEQNALYDAEILYMDHHLGRLLDGLRARGLYDSSWIVVTADHGELLGEQGRFGHGASLSWAELHVPLLVKPPAGRARPERRDEPVSQTDVLPLLLDGLGLALPGGVQGGLPPDVGHPILAELHPLTRGGDERGWRVLLEGDLKLEIRGRGAQRLFDVARDPEESHDLLPGRSRHAQALAQRLSDYLAGLPAPPSATPAASVDDATRRALERLGYVEQPR